MTDDLRHIPAASPHNYTAPPPRCACARCGRFVGCGEHWGPCDHCESEGHSPKAIFCAVCAPAYAERFFSMI